MAFKYRHSFASSLKCLGQAAINSSYQMRPQTTYSLLSVLKTEPLTLSCSRYHSKYSRTVKPVSVKSVKRKQASHNDFKERSDKVMGWKKKSAVVEMQELGEQADNITATVNRLTSLHTALEAEEEQIQDLKRTSNIVRFKTLERKYFRKPKSLNLLTWDAKEQMRYLHAQEGWSVEELADKYPVSSEIVKRILKSRIRLHRDENVFCHDHDIRNNWAKIKAALEKGEDIDQSLLDGMRNSENKFVIRNAVGIDTFPLPKSVGPPRPKGPFTMIVKDCLIEKMKEHKVKEQVKLETLSNFSQELEVLTEFMNKKDDEISDKKAAAKYKNQAQGHSTNSAHTNDEQFFRRKVEDRIDVGLKGHSKGNKLATYQHGDCVYDQSGEFLYRIP